MFGYSLFANELVGEAAVGLAKTFASPGHEAYKIWTPLFHPDKGNEFQGYLKLSVSVVKDGQTHEEHMGDDDDDDGMVVLPPDVDSTPYSLQVAFHRGEDLPTMDRWGSCDGYMQLDFGGSVIATEPVNNSLNPEWCTEVRMNVSVPTMVDGMSIELYDSDYGMRLFPLRVHMN